MGYGDELREARLLGFKEKKMVKMRESLLCEDLEAREEKRKRKGLRGRDRDRRRKVKKSAGAAASIGFAAPFFFVMCFFF
jgi:hypothetical protein